MKKIYLFCLATMLFLTPAHSSNTACTINDLDGDAYYGGLAYQSSGTDWVVSHYNADGDSIHGIAVCGGSILNSEQDDTPIDYWSANSVYCWCKIIYPFETEWFVGDDMANSYFKASNCYKRCAEYCAGMPNGYGQLPTSIKIR